MHYATEHNVLHYAIVIFLECMYLEYIFVLHYAIFITLTGNIRPFCINVYTTIIRVIT